MNTALHKSCIIYLREKVPIYIVILPFLTCPKQGDIKFPWAGFWLWSRRMAEGLLLNKSYGNGKMMDVER